jgi:hypothetical protein
MFKRILVNFALKILKIEVLDKIQYPAAQNIIAIGYENLKRSAEIVLDNDPDNKAQFQVLWATERQNLLSAAIETTKEIIIEEVKDERTESYIVGLLEEIQEAIKN